MVEKSQTATVWMDKTLKIIRFQLPSPQLVQPHEIQPSKHSRSPNEGQWPRRNFHHRSAEDGLHPRKVPLKRRYLLHGDVFPLRIMVMKKKIRPINYKSKYPRRFDPNTQEGNSWDLKKNIPRRFPTTREDFKLLGCLGFFFCCWAFGTIQLGSLQYPPVGLAQLSQTSWARPLEKKDPKCLHHLESRWRNPHVLAYHGSVS